MTSFEILFDLENFGISFKILYNLCFIFYLLFLIYLNIRLWGSLLKKFVYNKCYFYLSKKHNGFLLKSVMWIGCFITLNSNELDVDLFQQVEEINNSDDVNFNHFKNSQSLSDPTPWYKNPWYIVPIAVGATVVVIGTYIYFGSPGWEYMINLIPGTGTVLVEELDEGINLINEPSFPLHDVILLAEPSAAFPAHPLNNSEFFRYDELEDLWEAMGESIGTEANIELLSKIDMTKFPASVQVADFEFIRDYFFEEYIYSNVLDKAVEDINPEYRDYPCDLEELYIYVGKERFYNTLVKATNYLIYNLTLI